MAPKMKITDDMIKAGVAQLEEGLIEGLSIPGHRESLVRSIYRAMVSRSDLMFEHSGSVQLSSPLILGRMVAILARFELPLEQCSGRETVDDRSAD
jgi:hypothetical protein